MVTTYLREYECPVLAIIRGLVAPMCMMGHLVVTAEPTIMATMAIWGRGNEQC